MLTTGVSVSIESMQHKIYKLTVGVKRRLILNFELYIQTQTSNIHLALVIDLGSEALLLILLCNRSG